MRTIITIASRSESWRLRLGAMVIVGISVSPDNCRMSYSEHSERSPVGQDSPSVRHDPARVGTGADLARFWEGEAPAEPDVAVRVGRNDIPSYKTRGSPGGSPSQLACVQAFAGGRSSC